MATQNLGRGSYPGVAEDAALVAPGTLTPLMAFLSAGMGSAGRTPILSGSNLRRDGGVSVEAGVEEQMEFGRIYHTLFWRSATH